LASYNEKITFSFNEVALRLKSQNGRGHETDAHSLIDEIDKKLAEFRQTGITHKFGSDDIQRLSVVVSCIMNILSSLDKASVAIDIIKIKDETFVTALAEAV
jgi:hypothetical protein